jgi:hypothetical protein
MRERTEADDIVQGAYNRALLDLILPAMRRAALDAGYALTVHGSLNRDIDLVAVPWRDGPVWSADRLVEALCGAARGVIGRFNWPAGKERWAEKPHGRRATTLLAWCGENTAQIDLSVLSASEIDEAQ